MKPIIPDTERCSFTWFTSFGDRVRCPNRGEVTYDGQLHCDWHAPETMEEYVARIKIAAQAKARQERQNDHRLATWMPMRDALEAVYHAVEDRYGSEVAHSLPLIAAALEATREKGTGVVTQTHRIAELEEEVGRLRDALVVAQDVLVASHGYLAWNGAYKMALLAIEKALATADEEGE